MPHVTWSPAALADVQRLYEFLQSKGPVTAREAIKSIRQSIRVLAHQPEIGRPIDDMPIEFREWLIDFGRSGYVALYRYDGTETLILAVRHQKEVGYS